MRLKPVGQHFKHRCLESKSSLLFPASDATTAAIHLPIATPVFATPVDYPQSLPPEVIQELTQMQTQMQNHFQAFAQDVLSRWSAKHNFGSLASSTAGPQIFQMSGATP